MRAFTPEETPASWGPKFNFADRNNVLVGFDSSAQCCETFGWTISAKEFDTSEDRPSEADLDPYAFDVQSMKRRDEASEEGGEVSFRLVAEGKPDLWLTLFNHHNGYYSHGFEMAVDGKCTVEGDL